MSRKAFIHIGTHKTGTTYLQKWMLRNTAPLAELGLFYPKIGLGKQQPAQFKLSADARRCTGDLVETETWSELHRQLMTTDKDVILSAETLSDRIRTKTEAARIVDFFTQRNIAPQFIVFLRDVPAYMNSRYVQDAKYLRLTGSFADYVEAHREDVTYNYVTLLKPFEETAPVTVLPFTRKGPLIEHRFLAAMGRSEEQVAKLAWKKLVAQNQSFGPAAIKIARQLAAERPPKMSKRVLTDQGRSFRRLCNLYGLNKTSFVGCDVETANAIRAEFAPYTDAIAEKYFAQSWSETVPPEGMFERFEQSEKMAETTSKRKIRKIYDYVRAAGLPNSNCPISLPRKYSLILETEARWAARKAYGQIRKKLLG